MPKLKTPFKHGHVVQYGLEVAERDPKTSAVLAASCRFCLKFGREARPGAKRKRTGNTKVFKSPFRADSYKRHMEDSHPQKWREYSACAGEQKAVFFDGVTNYASTIMAHMETEGAMTLTFNRDVVEVIIGDLLFDPDDTETQPTRERALSIFKPFEDAARAPGGDGEDLNLEAYTVVIKHVRRFRMVQGFISMGASFRSASKFVGVARDVCKNGFLAGCSEGVCAEYTRIICACAYQAIYEILSTCWGYSIALDVGGAQGRSYLDMRIRFCVKSGLSNVHAIAIPLYTNKTAGTQVSPEKTFHCPRGPPSSIQLYILFRARFNYLTP
jgi:hypothetical protein